jgi:hypothetical protein
MHFAAKMARLRWRKADLGALPLSGFVRVEFCGDSVEIQVLARYLEVD